MLEEILQQLTQTEADCRQMVADAELQRQQTIATAQQNANKLYDTLLAEAHTEGEALLQAAKNEIAEEESRINQLNLAARQQLQNKAAPYREQTTHYIIERLCEDGDCRNA